MKLRALGCFFGIAVIVLLAAAAPPGEVEITAEPSHHIIFQNSNVRVFLVDVAPGSATLMHHHRHDYIYAVLGDAAISNELAGKPPADLRLRDGETRFMQGNFAHLVRDKGSTPFRNVTVELLKDEDLRIFTTKWDEDRGMNVLNGGTLDILFVKDSVRVSEIDLQPGGIAPPLRRHPGPQLLVALSDVHLLSSLLKGASKPIDLNAGQVLWMESRMGHSLKNRGSARAKFLAIEFP